MKKIVGVIILITTLIHCKEPKEVQRDTTFSKLTGEVIPFGVAQRWVATHRSGNSKKIQSYKLTRQSIEELFYPLSNKLGFVLHHGLDEQLKHHIVLTPMAEDQSLLQGGILDINHGHIDKTTALHWIENFKTENSAAIRSHYFGIHVIEDILSTEEDIEIEIIEGTDDSGKAQLLVYVWTLQSSSSGRVMVTDPTVYDKSTSCPNHCADLN